MYFVIKNILLLSLSFHEPTWQTFPNAVYEETA